MVDRVILEVPLDDEVDRKLGAEAASRGVGKAELAATLLREVTVSDPAYSAFVKVGLEDMAAGRLYDHAEVVARIERILAAGQ